MGELIELRNRAKKRTTTKPDTLGSSATTFVLVPSQRFSDLRKFWMDLKADIAADADDTPQHLIRR
jgi:hypothetical protein